jgi:DNA (cytosine-5)-methyltransferase 1
VSVGRKQPTAGTGRQARGGRWPGDPLALPNIRGARLSLPALHPDIQANTSAARSWLSKLSRPWAVDLFSGCGGLGLGLERAGFNVVAAADSDATALETYAANLGAPTWCGDLADPSAFVRYLASLGVETVDVVAGGPPCQPFSRAGSSKIRSLVAEGSRASQDSRVDLWQSFMAVVDALSPQAVMLENVPDMASWDDGSILLAIMQALIDRGYVTDARVLQAEFHGVPQHRQRLFVVARRRGAFSWPRRRRTRVDLEAAIGDLPEIEPGGRQLVTSYAGPMSPFQIRARRGMRPSEKALVHDHISRAVRDDDAEAFSLLKPGQTYRDLPDRLKRYRDDIFDDKYKRLAWDNVSRTITAHIARDGYWYIHPDQPRTLSIREAARIQTFPDAFRFCGHPSIQYRQIGNAVPPALGEAVARRVLAALRSDEPARSSTFGERLRAWQPAGPSDYGQDTAWAVLVRELCLSRQDPQRRQELLRKVLAVAPSPADATTQSVALSECLGPQARSRLIAVAKVIVSRHGGQIPDTDEALRALPGVGTHAAASIRCFGFGQRTPLANQGVRRVIERVSGQPTSSIWTTRLQLLGLAGADGPDVSFNAALLHLAAECCLPHQPRCGSCPVRPECRRGQSTSRQGQSPDTSTAAASSRRLAA